MEHSIQPIIDRRVNVFRRVIIGTICVSLSIGVAVWFGWRAQAGWITQFATGSAEPAGPSARIVFLDVGQGDAIYIRTVNGQDVLIDGGPSDAVVRRLGEVMPFWDRTIELMILTHPDADHVTGLVDVFDYYQVTQVAYVPLSVQSQTQQAFLDAITEQGTQVLHVWGGDTIQLSPYEQLRMVFPFTDTPVESLARNNTSQVMLYEFSGDAAYTTKSRPTKLLLTGDIEIEVETIMVQAGVLEDIDILKVPHHGSATSSSTPFLNATQPELAVIQVGVDNRYGHPKSEIVQRLGEYASTILRIDLLGNIACEISTAGYVCDAR